MGITQSYDGFVYPNESYVIDGVKHEGIPNLTKPERKISDKLAKDLKNMYVDVRNILDENEIPHWVYFGTLLGTIRHGGFIPWDDDLDIKIYFKDMNRLKKVFKNSQKYKLKYLEGMCFVKVFPKNAIGMQAPFIDIFFDLEEGDKQGSCEFKNCLTLCDKINLNKTDVFPLQKMQFEDIWVYVPNNPDQLLTQKYGNYWDIRVDESHEYTWKQTGIDV